jgi:hypothetical protein
MRDGVRGGSVLDGCYFVSRGYCCWHKRSSRWACAAPGFPKNNYIMSIVIRELNPGELEDMLHNERSDRIRYALEPHEVEALTRYVRDRIEPGDFLSAVISNDLKEACGRADHLNRRKIFEYCEWLYNNAPRACWGSSDRMNAWLSQEEAS